MSDRGYPPSIANDILANIKPTSVPYLYLGSTRETAANRVQFGEAVSNFLDQFSKEENAKKCMVIDSMFYSLVTIRYILLTVVVVIR